MPELAVVRNGTQDSLLLSSFVDRGENISDLTIDLVFTSTKPAEVWARIFVVRMLEKSTSFLLFATIGCLSVSVLLENMKVYFIC